jgi:transposase-like protein
MPMDREQKDLRIAIEQWRANPPPGKKEFPPELKLRALKLFEKGQQPPKVLASEIGICVSLFYSWRRWRAEIQSFTEELKFSKEADAVSLSATKIHLESVPTVAKNATLMIAKLQCGGASIEFYSADSLLAVCEKLVSR